MEKEYWFEIRRPRGWLKKRGLIPINAKGYALIVGYPLLCLSLYDFADKHFQAIGGSFPTMIILTFVFILIVASKTDRSFRAEDWE